MRYHVDRIRARMMTWPEVRLAMHVRSARLILVLVSSLGSLLVSECAVRSIRPQLTYSRLLLGSFSAWAASDFNTHTLKPNFRGTEYSRDRPERRVSVTINADGLRGPGLRPSPRDRLLILGDSYTFGLYLDDAETYPAQLQRIFDVSGLEVEVLTAGYASAFETDQHYVWFKRTGTRFEPSITLLGFFLGNDIDGIDFKAWRDLDDLGLPTRHESSDTYVDAFGRLRAATADGAEVGGEFFYRVPILRESHLFIAGGKVIDRFALGHRVGYTEAMFAHIFGDFAPEFLEKERAAIALIEGMKQTAAQAGSSFAVILLPINFMVDPTKLPLVVPTLAGRTIEADYYDRFARLLAARGITSLNIGALMR